MPAHHSCVCQTRWSAIEFSGEARCMKTLQHRMPPALYMAGKRRALCRLTRTGVGGALLSFHSFPLAPAPPVEFSSFFPLFLLFFPLTWRSHSVPFHPSSHFLVSSNSSRSIFVVPTSPHSSSPTFQLSYIIPLFHPPNPPPHLLPIFPLPPLGTPCSPFPFLPISPFSLSTSLLPLFPPILSLRSSSFSIALPIPFLTSSPR